MKSPITGKEMVLKTRQEYVSFRKEKFSYTHFYFQCEDSGESFTTTELDELNLNQVYNQYRSKHNIPGTKEIIGLRKKLGLSASKMSLILGFGTNGYRNYEKGEVPNQAHANLLRLALNDLSVVEELVTGNDGLSSKEKQRILAMLTKLQEEGKELRQDREYLQQLLGGSSPGNFSGYVKPDVEKLGEMIVYFTAKLGPTKTVMNKLLFYSDFYAYSTTGYSISGARYVAIDYGPVPDRYLAIFDYAIHNNLIKINEEHYGNGYATERFCSTEKKFNPAVFSEKELEALKMVAEKFKQANAKEITELSHQEPAWTENHKSKQLIDYKYGFELKNM